MPTEICVTLPDCNLAELCEDKGCSAGEEKVDITPLTPFCYPQCGAGYTSFGPLCKVASSGLLELPDDDLKPQTHSHSSQLQALIDAAVANKA